MDAPKPGWAFYRSEGCQLQVVYPGKDDPGRPMQKACLWIANFNLSAMELRCRKPSALAPTTHTHRHCRGGMTVTGEGSMNVAAYSGRYTAVQGTVYGKSCRVFCDTHERPTGSTPLTRLRKLANESKAARRLEEGKQPYENTEGMAHASFSFAGMINVSIW